MKHYKMVKESGRIERASRVTLEADTPEEAADLARSLGAEVIRYSALSETIYIK